MSKHEQICKDAATQDKVMQIHVNFPDIQVLLDSSPRSFSDVTYVNDQVLPVLHTSTVEAGDAQVNAVELIGISVANRERNEFPERLTIKVNGSAIWGIPLDLLCAFSPGKAAEGEMVRFPTRLLYQYVEQNIVPLTDGRKLTFDVDGTEGCVFVHVRYCHIPDDRVNDDMLIREFLKNNEITMTNQDASAVSAHVEMFATGIFVKVPIDYAVLADSDVTIVALSRGDVHTSKHKVRVVSERLFYIPLYEVEEWNSGKQLPTALNLSRLDAFVVNFHVDMPSAKLFISAVNQITNLPDGGCFLRYLP